MFRPIPSRVVASPDSLVSTPERKYISARPCRLNRRDRRNPIGRQAAFFTEAGLEALQQLLQDRPGPWSRSVENDRSAITRVLISCGSLGNTAFIASTLARCWRTA